MKKLMREEYELDMNVFAKKLRSGTGALNSFGDLIGTYMDEWFPVVESEFLIKDKETHSAFMSAIESSEWPSIAPFIMSNIRQVITYIPREIESIELDVSTND